MEYLELLRESLPYIQRFKGKVFVIKFSGKVTEDRENLVSLAEEIALIHQIGIKVCVVHGGGRQLSMLAEKLGVSQTIIAGRRVTDDETLELAKMVFAGKINTDILAALRRQGVEAVGLSGVDGNIVHAEKRPPRLVRNDVTGEAIEVDFGNVGDVLRINGKLLNLLLENGYLPVISSLAADSEGRIYNINADTVASEIAIQLEAEKLIFLSDIDGVYLELGNKETKISKLSLSEMERLIESGVIRDGMVPKFESIVSLLRCGVKSAHIVNGTERNALLSEIFTDAGKGTMFTIG
ncbi:MAG: acetylglutamate kinase [Pyrinomonadaceae bacterium]|nr:acetylglutamate kinase [Pyrinomonadaceae bacterium]MCX7640138.1 acetylglutamate kinase [Pyrinomonadaceae bacterium]MDW8303274.1 acetylglutamate kinase [Acidobacteriota bacterium]